MKYTIKSFIQSFVGDKSDMSHVINNYGNELYLKWDGLLLYILDKDKEQIYYVSIIKQKKNLFSIDLSSQDCWALSIEFSDGGLVKNKFYKINDYIDYL